MAAINFEVLEEASIVYEQVTYEGKIKINEETITYRYSEDDNGAYFYVHIDDNWEEVDYGSNENYGILFHSIQMYGNPKEFGKSGVTFVEDSSNII